jgi:hypothetical protein
MEKILRHCGTQFSMNIAKACLIWKVTLSRTASGNEFQLRCSQRTWELAVLLGRLCSVPEDCCQGRNIEGNLGGIEFNEETW